MTRTLVLVWIALMALLAATLAIAYVPLGDGNLVAALGIAFAKVALVAWWFMRLNEASAKTRVAAGIALAFFALLVGLGGVDYATRARNAAPAQDAKQLVPRFAPAALPGSPARQAPSRPVHPVSLPLRSSSAVQVPCPRTLPAKLPPAAALPPTPPSSRAPARSSSEG